ncbi:MAG: hypothetical protein J6Y01_09550 [Spirochaetales bacterium]|nr:hypothetical protein [Spirochaetales bacterium]
MALDPIGTALNVIPLIGPILPNLLLVFGVNGDNDTSGKIFTANHQLGRMYNVIKQCFNKIYADNPSILDDKQVNIN